MSQKSDIINVLGSYLLPGQQFTADELQQGLAAQGTPISNKGSMYTVLSSLKLDGIVQKMNKENYIYVNNGTGTVPQSVNKTPQPVNEIILPNDRVLTVLDDAVWISRIVYDFDPDKEDVQVDRDKGVIRLFTKLADL